MTASVCAKSVTSPIKQFEMNGLLDEIEQLREKAYEERTQQVSVHTWYLFFFLKKIK
jgi:hypothetical protein